MPKEKAGMTFSGFFDVSALEELAPNEKREEEDAAADVADELLVCTGAGGKGDLGGLWTLSEEAGCQVLHITFQRYGRQSA